MTRWNKWVAAVALCCAALLVLSACALSGTVELPTVTPSPAPTARVNPTPPSSAPTRTPEPPAPTPTSTPVPPTATPTANPVPSPSPAPVPTATPPEIIPTPAVFEVTATPTPEPAPTPVPTPTPAPTPAPTPTPTPTPSPVPSATPTATPVPTRSGSTPTPDRRKGKDKQLPSTSPPGGLTPEQVPQFVVFASDDNVRTNGNNWLVNLFAGRVNPPGAGNPATFDGSKTRATFFVLGRLDQLGRDVAQSMQRAYTNGNEIGSHGYAHKGGLTAAGWVEDTTAGIDVLTRSPDLGGLGVAPADIFGFRAADDRYNADMFTVLWDLGFTYDASIIEGYQAGHDGTNEYWPYTLDEGSPGAEWNKARKITGNAPPGSIPGLWELPETVYRVPPELKSRYGSTVYGCDWNWIHEDKMEKRDMVTIFKYNLDLRLDSNRAPLQLCIHSQYFGVEKWFTESDRASIAAMQDVMTQMLDYAISKPEVRVVAGIDVINWMRSPTPLRKEPAP